MAQRRGGLWRRRTHRVGSKRAGTAAGRQVDAVLGATRKSHEHMTVARHQADGSVPIGKKRKMIAELRTGRLRRQYACSGELQTLRLAAEGETQQIQTVCVSAGDVNPTA